MRVFFTTAAGMTRAILRHGFRDEYKEGDLRGVWFADQPLGANEGFAGDVTLCVEVPEDVFAHYQWVEEPPIGYRRSLLPAAVLNRLGPPQIYSHTFASGSRRDLVRALRQREEEGRPEGYPSAEDLRAAIEFFDEVGWRTPLCVREDG
jgi:hypothetical protein